MKISSFDKVRELSQQIQTNTTGEPCGVFGNNVNSPIDNGLNEYNKGIGFMTYGNYKVPVTEAINYSFDVGILKDNLGLLKAFMNKHLKELNSRIRTQPRQLDQRASVISQFAKSMPEFEKIGSQMDYEDANQVDNIVNIDITDQFANQLRKIYSTYFGTPKQLEKFVMSAIGVVAQYNLKTWDEFINKVESLSKAGILHPQDINPEASHKEMAIDKFKSDVISSMLTKYSDEELQKDILDLAEKESAIVYADHKWSRNNISQAELTNAVINEIRTGGVDLDVLKNLYK